MVAPPPTPAAAPACAMARLLRVEPMLARTALAGDVLRLPPLELLHAGPPLRDPRRPPAVLRSSAVMTCLHEGWAASIDDAESMLLAGELRLSPAQPRGCVVPLALVVSARTPLFEVRDGDRRMHAPVSTVRGADTRMGCRDPGLLQRLGTRDRDIAPAWQRLLSEHGPLPLLPLAALGLAGGDDLHSRTSAANAALADWLRQHDAHATLADAVEATPLFFLTIWMAACALMLRAAEGADRPALVTRGGGNGERFGIALAGSAAHWTCVAATPPAGRPAASAATGTAVCNAIGDSAVIDLLGCGGQALAGASEPRQALAGFVPDDLERHAERLLAARHPVLNRLVGLDARCVVATGSAPLVALTMQAADGIGGFVGRGVYRPPVELFRHALGEPPA